MLLSLLMDSITCTSANVGIAVDLWRSPDALSWGYEMTHITEIIPDDIPDWMREAIQSGNVFARCNAIVKENEILKSAGLWTRIKWVFTGVK